MQHNRAIKTSLTAGNSVKDNQQRSLNRRSYDNPGNYNEKAGQNNYTVFAILYKEKTGINVQRLIWLEM